MAPPFKCSCLIGQKWGWGIGPLQKFSGALRSWKSVEGYWVLAPPPHTRGLRGNVLPHSSSTERCLCGAPACDQRGVTQCFISRWPRRPSAHCSWAPSLKLGNEGLCGPCPHVRKSQVRQQVLGGGVGVWARVWRMTRESSTRASWALEGHTLGVSAKILMLPSWNKPKPS